MQQRQCTGSAGHAAPLVTAVKATAQNVPQYLDEIGRNAAFEAVTVTPQVGGRIVERDFQDGENLARGNCCLSSIPVPSRRRLMPRKPRWPRRRPRSSWPRFSLLGTRRSSANKQFRKQDYDTKKNAVDVDQAQVESAQAALETAKLNLEYCYIHSPIDGRAGARLVDVGNVVQANTTSLLSIQRLDPIYANFTVTESDLPECKSRCRRGTLRRQSGFLPILKAPRERARGISGQCGAKRQRYGKPARHDEQPRPPFLARPVCGREARFGTKRRAVLIPNQAAQISQQGTVRLRGESGRHSGIPSGEAGSASGRSGCSHRRRRPERARSARRPNAGSARRQGARRWCIAAARNNRASRTAKPGQRQAGGQS